MCLRKLRRGRASTAASVGWGWGGGWGGGGGEGLESPVRAAKVDSMYHVIYALAAEFVHVLKTKPISTCGLCSCVVRVPRVWAGRDTKRFIPHRNVVIFVFAVPAMALMVDR
jgi:hypothetical protein